MNRFEIAQRIQKVIDEHPINGEKLSAYKLNKLGILSSANYSHYMTGKYKPNRQSLIKFAEYFNVSVDWIMTGQEPEITEEPPQDVTIPGGYWKILNDLSNALKERDKEIQRLHDYIEWLQNGAIIPAHPQVEKCNESTGTESGQFPENLPQK